MSFSLALTHQPISQVNNMKYNTRSPWKTRGFTLIEIIGRVIR